MALKVDNRRQRHSVIVLKGKRIIAQATNRRGHAEQIALHVPQNIGPGGPKVPKPFRGCTLISFRATPQGHIGKSKPCLQCEEEILYAQIRKVIYFDGEKWIEEFR